MKKGIIVDLDGTLALFEGVREWHEFHRVGEDKLRESVAKIVRAYFEHVIIITGRPQSCFSETNEWLRKHGIEYSEMYMRTSLDDRPDYVVKREIYEKHIKPFYTIDFVLDDRNSVVAMWRELGLDCFQIQLTNY